MVSFSSIPNVTKTSHGFSFMRLKIKLPRNKSFKATISKPGFTTEVKVDSLPSGAAVGAVGSALIGGVLLQI